MAFRLELGDGWRLAAPDLSQPAAALALAELETAMGPPGVAGIEVSLAHGDGPGEGFRRRAGPDGVELRGESARGLLFGVYAMLEELGERWLWPGEHRARGEDARLEERVQERPALQGRCLVLGERALVDQVESWIVWAARNRLNCAFVHVSTRDEPYGSAPEAAWRERRERAVGLAHERGMTLEHGGHLLPELLEPRDLRALAEGRPLAAGARRALEEHLRAHPEADVLHLWGADAPAGSDGREASAAALRTANTLAEIAESAVPGAQVAYLAYHDTIEVPRGVRPRHNVCLVFAPRERCYEHALADPGCRTNARYREALHAQIDHFDAAGAGSARVFEYWFDAILFADGVPDLTEMMADDLALYRDAGVHTVQMLVTGHDRAPSPHPNPPAFGRLAWDPGRGRRA